MFERYTEKARRVIFFARYEASQFGSADIETEHLLLGLLREDKALTNRFLRSHASVESIRKQIEGHATIQEKISTSVDLPLSNESKRVLAYAAEEAERLSNKQIGPEHLFLGLLREEKCFAAEILHERGLRLSTVREEVARSQSDKTVTARPKEGSLLSKFGRDLTQAAIEGQLPPSVDRDSELKRVVEILCRHTNNCPVIIGDPDAARSSIIEGLARRIAAGGVPPPLQDKRIVAFDLSRLETESTGPAQWKERLRCLMKELTEAQTVLIFIEELCAISASLSFDGWLDAANILKPDLLLGKIQFVAATTSSGYNTVIGKHSELVRCFQEVRVAPLSETECMTTLVSVKERLEKFHSVVFDDVAIVAAMAHVKRDNSERSLLVKVMDLLDEAAAHVQVRQDNLPDDIRDVQKRIKFIQHRMESALTNHEFEKARFYSDEERKEREKLRRLREKYNIGETPSILHVTNIDIDEVGGSWAGTADG